MAIKYKSSLPKCPNVFTNEFGKQLISALGGDVLIIKDNWCWVNFCVNFKHLRPAAERYFEEATTGNPSWAAYQMVKYCGSSKEWAERVIKSAKVGDPATVAYHMVEYCGSSNKWTEKVIENAKVGDPALAAFRMVKYCGSSKGWAEKVIENAKVGDPALAAFRMVKYCGSSKIWALKVSLYQRIRRIFKR